MSISTRPIDDIMLGASGLLFVGLGVWTIFGGIGSAGSPELPAPGPNATYRPTALSNPDNPAEVWTAPAVAEGTNDGLVDVFTPPVIYYDVANHEFSVTPPDSGMGETRVAATPFGLELVEVKRTPYRIQLVGYVGSEGDYIATFEDVEAGETFLARPGKTVEAPGVILRSFTVEKVRDQSGGGTVVQDTRAIAVIRDLRQDRDITLVQKTRLMNDVPTAVFRVTGELSRNVEGKQGETLSVGEAIYTIGMVTTDPPTAEVTREASGERGTEIRRLELAPVIEAVAQPESTPFQFPPSTQNNPFGPP